MELRQFAETVLFEPSVDAKLLRPETLEDRSPGEAITTPSVPAREARLAFDSQRPTPPAVSSSKLHLQEHAVAALHMFANHELLALELLALTILRFPKAPKGYRMSLAATMLDEQRHLRLYIDRLTELEASFGDFAVNRFFWDSLSRVASPAAFAAAMGMTLEQANLDFSSHFAAAFHAAGDAASASILEQIHDDEIGHLRQGRMWFDRLCGHSPQDDSSLFLRWSAALEPPMSPARGRGIGFDAQGRLAAGLPQKFIDQVAMARHSRGRLPVVYWMNPACEQRLGHGGPLPQAALAMERDLETLPVAWAKADDVVLVHETPPLDLQQRWASAGLEVPQWAPAEGLDEPTHPLTSRRLSAVEPWGWEPEVLPKTRPLLQRATLSSDVLRSEAQWSRWIDERAVLSRKDLWSDALNQDLAPELRSKVCVTREELTAALQEHSDSATVVKAPLGSAGRGALRLPPHSLRPELWSHEVKWVERTLRRQGALVVSRWLRRRVDVSALFHVKPQGAAQILGVSRFMTDSRGQYLATVLGPATVGLPTSLRTTWHGDGDPKRAVRALFEPVVQRVAARLQEAGHFGLAGIDGLIWGEETPAVFPAVEVNPRRTMGHVALSLQAKMSPGRSGLLLMVNHATAKTLSCASISDAVREISRRVGPLRSDAQGRVTQGVIALNAIEGAVLCAPVWVVARRGDDLMDALEPLALPWAGLSASPFEQR